MRRRYDVTGTEWAYAYQHEQARVRVLCQLVDMDPREVYRGLPWLPAYCVDGDAYRVLTDTEAEQAWQDEAQADHRRGHDRGYVIAHADHVEHVVRDDVTGETYYVYRIL